ncbi:MAG: quinolinate synthase NadA, partial [Peptostreptococcus stomatis]
DVAIVSYINTKADVKSKSDVCVTSSNAMKIVSGLPNKNIYFLPDRNLGRYIADRLQDKNFIFHEGYCKYHNFVDYEEVKALKEKYAYDVLVHPECTSEVVSLGDCVGSTKALLDYVEKTKKAGYIVCTEEGILHQMNKVSPKSEFIIPTSMKACEDMKKNSLENLYKVLVDEGPEIVLDEAIMERASQPLKKMMEMS